MSRYRHILIGIVTITANLFLTTGTLAQSTTDSTSTTLPPLVTPYQQTFTITAYYSPIEGQKRYVRGSYAADKKLNGNGTHGADGTNVFPGMIAAPKTYAFGTKMNIPGIGTVAVHDRGGAIVNAGSRGQQYDRLDIWMGQGDIGLNRALHWGRRTMQVTVYGIDPNIKENIDLSGISSQDFPDSNPVSAQLKLSNFGLGDNDQRISEIKQKLTDLHYFQGTINNNFDHALYNSVLKFQIDYQIVDSDNDFGAGYFGPQTRVTLEKALQGVKATPNVPTLFPIVNADSNPDLYQKQVLLAGNGLSFLSRNLSTGDSGQPVIELQTELAKLHLFGIDPTGYYGEVTAHAVFKFQQTQGLISDEQSFGAGIFGSLTRAKLCEIVGQRIQTRQNISEKAGKTI